MARAALRTSTETATRRRRLGVAEGHAHYKWWALSCTSLGMLLAATNSGTLIIALPDLERSLHASLLALVWVILAYLIAATVLVLMAGRLSDLFGRKRAYIGGFIVFALASLGAGFSPNAEVLIVWRVLQGIGSAFLFANAAALVTDAFPHDELGLAMGTNTMVAAIGLAIGPVLGGVLVGISWHWVFWFNVPLGLAGAAWGALILRELSKPDEIRGYDVLGNLTFILGLTGLVLGVSRGGLSGWDDPIVIGGLLAALVLLPLWVADREPLARPDARPDAVQEPPVRGRHRRGLHQRAGALRADVPVRLLLPGRPGRQPDHRRGEADPARAGDARLLPAGRHLRRPPRLARPGGAGDAGERGRARRDDHAAGGHPLLAEHAVAAARSAWARGCSTAPTPPR